MRGVHGWPSVRADPAVQAHGGVRRLLHGADEGQPYVPDLPVRHQLVSQLHLIDPSTYRMM